MAVLFLVTALGVSLYTFVSRNNNNNQASGNLNCPIQPLTIKQTKKSGKLQGAKLAGFSTIKRIDYLQCRDFKIGTGTAATASSTVVANYTGAIASSGIIFQSSLDSGQPATFQLTGVIPGWTSGVPGMRAGGERRLLIPAQYAYGSNPPPGSGIPPNADLVFDISLLAVK